MQCSNLKFRSAEDSDSKFVWELANDPLVRGVSFSSDLIPWEDHQVWFSGRLADENCLFYIVENDKGEKVGQIRFELKDEGWVISLSIVKEFRGHGLGSEIIRSGSHLLFDTKPETDKIFAYIKNDNIASVRVFEKAGYKHQGPASINCKGDAVLMCLGTVK